MNEKKQINWSAVKAEYIAGGISQKQLSEKYQIPFQTVRSRAYSEKWTGMRAEATAKSTQKSINKTAESVANNAVTAMRIRQKLLSRLEKEIDALPEYIGTNAHNNDSSIEYEAGKAKRPTKQKDSYIEYKLRDLTSAWKDLTEGLIITEENPNQEDSGFTDALKGTASASWADNEE